MSYAAPKKKSSITVGNLARKDPVVAYSSVVASSILLKAAQLPRADRLQWIRTEMNKTDPGFGDDAVSKFRQLTREGKTRNQSLFDAIRLTIANRLTTYIDKNLPRHSTAGMGDTSSDVRLAMCTGYAVGAGAGGATGGFLNNPAASGAVIDSMRVAAEIQGCGLDQLNAQARIAEANAAAAAAAAASNDGAEVHAFASPAALMALGVGGVVLLGIVGYAVVKK
jgi:hypothetical protein